MLFIFIIDTTFARPSLPPGTVVTIILLSAYCSTIPTAINIANKFTASETLIKTKISSYVFTYFTYIRDLFAQMDGCDGFMFSILSSQIHCAFQKMDATNASKNEIFDSLVNWIGNKTHNASKEACEAVVSFFVQNCEVFYEISQ